MGTYKCQSSLYSVLLILTNWHSNQAALKQTPHVFFLFCHLDEYPISNESMEQHCFYVVFLFVMGMTDMNMCYTSMYELSTTT